MEIILPFDGFYNSLSAFNVDSAVEIIADGNEELMEMMFQEIDFKKVYEEYARAYVSEFQAMLANDFDLEVELNFKALESPKEYNFSTDRIICEISLDDAMTLYNAVSIEDLTSAIEKLFTPGSGFIPLYSSDVEDWQDMPLHVWDHNELHVLLMAIVGDSVPTMDDAINNGRIESMIWDNMSEKGVNLLNNA